MYTQKTYPPAFAAQAICDIAPQQNDLDKTMICTRPVIYMIYGLILAALMGCSGLNDITTADLETYTPRQIYDLGESELDQKRPEKAAEYFGEIERLHPYSEWAKRGLIMQAYAYHLNGDYESSRSSAQRYLDFYPVDEDAAYAQYLIALSYYDQIHEVGRDQGLTRKALEELTVVFEVYPDSDYADDAEDMFDLAFNQLAAKEMEVGRFYLKQGHYAAAVKRFRVVVDGFQTTEQTPEALYRLIEAYLSLGLVAEAQAAGAILEQQYKSSEWYAEGAALLDGRIPETGFWGDSWVSAMYRQMIQGKWL